MVVKEEYHNVSVRLKDSDYQKLLFLHNKFSSMSYGKVTYADVLRLSLTETFLRESKDPDNPVSNLNRQQEQKKQQTKKEDKFSNITAENVEQAISENPAILSKLAEIMSLNEVNSKPKETEKEVFIQALNDAQNDSSNTEEETETLTEGEVKPTVSSYDDIEKELEELEKGLRSATNSKNKPYSEKYIQDQLNKRRKELES